MRTAYPFFFYLAASFALLAVQVSVAPATFLGKFAPDFNLALIVCMALRTRIPYLFALAALNGFFMDAFSVGAPGINTFTRLALFLALRGVMPNLNWKTDGVRATAFSLFAGTLFLHLVLGAVLFLKPGGADMANLGLDLAIHQAIINTVVGVPLAALLKKLDGSTET